MELELKIWKEGQEVLVENELLHILVSGKNMEETFHNFEEALALTLEDPEMQEIFNAYQSELYHKRNIARRKEAYLIETMGQRQTSSEKPIPARG